MADTRLTIDPRFRGPDESGNGGYVCGLVAQLVGGEAEVTLRAPPPLGRPLRVERDADARVWDAETLVAEAAAGEIDVAIPTPVSFDDARAAALPDGDSDSPFPNCFVCGRNRAPGDGLRIFAGRLPGTDLVAATWQPNASLCRPELVWAALDCPGAYACDAIGRGSAVLGRLAARVERLPRPAEPCVVVGWPLGEEGRKLYAGTALFGEHGDVIGVARAVWIVPRS